MLTTTLRFSTDNIRPADRLRTWYSVFDRSVTRRTLSPLSDKPFDMSVTVSHANSAGNECLLESHGVHVQRMSFGAGFSAERTSQLVTDGNDDIVLYVHRAGRRHVSQFGREAEIAPGGGIAITNAAPSTIVVPEPARFVCIGVSRKPLSILVPNLEDALARALSGESGILQLLDGYLAVLEQDRSASMPELRQPVISHIYDLIAVALGSSRDYLEIANGRGIRAARLEAIKADIAKHLTEPDLTANAISLRQRVSPRYVYKLFESEGMTLSQYVLGQRLGRVHRMLTEARHAGRTIGALAFDVGFGDLSTFNHAFRRHYSATPSDVRAAARQLREKYDSRPPAGRMRDSRRLAA